MLLPVRDSILASLFILHADFTNGVGFVSLILGKSLERKFIPKEFFAILCYDMTRPASSYYLDNKKIFPLFWAGASRAFRSFTSF